MGGIFISYRREDSAPYAGRLRDTLSQHFGEEQVFRDIDRINPGERFPRVIEEAVGSCDALLALIGPTWLACRDEAGQRRLDNPDDYVHREIATALVRSDVLVIPVLVGPTSMPAAADLSKPLAALAECNALRITDENWDDQVARLTRAVEKVVKPRVPAPLPLPFAPPQAEVSTAARMDAGAAKPIENWLENWLWRKARLDISRAALIGYADNLADAVSRRETVLLDQLRGGPDMVVDDLEFRAEPRSRLAAGDAAGVLADIGPYFRRQEKRRMVVLGVAGAGKTVLAVRLVLDQLRQRAADDAAGGRDPVPVRINASGWNGSADFTAWLSNQVAVDYGLNVRVARAMVDTDRILPVLDGLDEMDAPEAEPLLASAALDRLNEPPWRNRAVVVACRSRVYEAIRELRGDAGLHFATAVTLQPLSADDIYIYLEQYRDELGIAEAAWEPVTGQLEQAPDGVLATALRTPWMLSLAATALSRRGHQTAVELSACRDTAQIRQVLFESLIPAAVEGTPRTSGTRTHSEQSVQRWLGTLARHFEQRRTEHSGGTQIALDQIWHLAGPRRCRALHALAAGLTVGLAAGLMFGLTFKLIAGLAWGLTAAITAGLTYGLVANQTAPKRFAWRVPPQSRWRSGLAFGLAVGLVSGLTFGFTLGRTYGLWYGLTAGIIGGLMYGHMANDTAPKRFAWRVPGRSRWRRGVASGLTFGLTFGLTAGLMYGLMYGLREGLTYGVTFGLAFGLTFGLVVGLNTKPYERLALGQDPRRIIHDDLVAGLVYGLTAGLVFGLALGFASGLASGPRHGLAVGLTFGLVTGLAIGLWYARTAGRHAIASLVFAFTETFAPRPAQFLEWARNAGLLRVTGIAYQCRHDSYEQWLAAGAVDRGVKTTLDAHAG